MEAENTSLNLRKEQAAPIRAVVVVSEDWQYGARQPGKEMRNFKLLAEVHKKVIHSKPASYSDSELDFEEASIAKLHGFSLSLLCEECFSEPK